MTGFLTAERRSSWLPWAVLVAATFVIATAAGGRFLIGLVFDQVRDEFDVQHGTLSLVVSSGILITGASQPLVGWLMDRLPARIVTGGGLVLLGIGLVSVSRAGSLPVLAVTYAAMVAPGLATITPAMTTPLVAGWFQKRRATALSIVAAGDPLGQALIVPGLALLVGGYGWRGTYLIFGLIMLCVLAPLLATLLRERDGMRRSNDGAAGNTVREAIATRYWWQLGVGFFICGFTMSWVIVFFVDYTLSQGMSRGVAATGLSVMGAMSIVGALSTGWWADRTGNTVPLATVYALRAAGFFLILLSSGPVMLVGSMVVVGLSWSATVPLTSSMIARIFGTRSLGAIFGLLFAIMPVGNAIGASTVGILHDLTGGYETSLLINLVAGLIAAAVVLPVHTTPRFSTVEQPAA